MKSLLDKVNAKLNAQGGFLKAISVLVGGTVFAQLIGFIALPILTRLYDTQEFGVFALYTSILSMLGVIGCLRYEIAIPIPEEKNKALNLVIISFFSLIFIVFILLIIMSLFNLLDYSFEWWYWLLPVNLLLMCSFNIFQYWFSREKDFHQITNTKIKQSSSVATMQTIFGYFGVAGGLMLGSVVGLFVGLLNHFTKFFKYNGVLGKCNLKDMKKVAIENKKFPIYSSLEALLNNGGVHLSLIIIGVFLEKKEIALVFLTIKVLAMPMSLIGTAISQAYLSAAPEMARLSKLTLFTNNLIKKIAIYSALPFIIIVMAAPKFSSIIFGDEWVGLGYYIVLMIPWFYFQLISSPVSFSLHVTGNQKAAMFLQLFGFLLRVGGVYMLCVLSLKNQVVIYYAFSGFLFYVIYLIVIQFYIRKSDRIVGVLDEYKK